MTTSSKCHHQQKHRNSSNQPIRKQYCRIFARKILHCFVLIIFFACDCAEANFISTDASSRNNLKKYESMAMTSQFTNSFQAITNLDRPQHREYSTSKQDRIEDFLKSSKDNGLYGNQFESSVNASNKMLVIPINTKQRGRFPVLKENSRHPRSIFTKPNVNSIKKYRIRLNGSQLSYVGQVQVALPEDQWGSICGDDWDNRDAMVVCRQLGFTLGGVIAHPISEIGNSSCQFVISKMQCRGNENKLDNCPMQRWNGRNSLPCKQLYKPAAVVCGCRLTVSDDVLSRCKVFTNSRFNRMFCRYTCPPGNYLLGSPRRYCEANQRWSGVSPRCVTADPCSSTPCLNGGTCEKYFEVVIDYICVCREGFGGKNCELKRTWTCGDPIMQMNMTYVRPQLRIVGGKTVRKGRWPWVVQLRLNDRHFCGGTLISPNYVITAQHCFVVRNIPSGVNNNKNLTVISGQHRLSGHDVTSQSHRVTYISSQGFSMADVPRRDMALVRLSRPVRVDDYTAPICLPSSVHDNPAPRTKCWVAGWGRSDLDKFAPNAPTLMQGEIPVLSNSRCKSWSWREKEKNYRLIDEAMMCAGYRDGGVDACLGDSGGPLMCARKDGSWYLAGIISWGYNCAEPYTPGVYTRVAHYLNWIYQIIRTV